MSGLRSASEYPPRPRKPKRKKQQPNWIESAGGRWDEDLGCWVYKGDPIVGMSATANNPVKLHTEPRPKVVTSTITGKKWIYDYKPYTDELGNTVIYGAIDPDNDPRPKNPGRSQSR